MKIALLGNPNTGKSSVFNMLTGMRQHVGNFPGVTVDKKTGKIQAENGTHELVDFPGTYSVYPRSKDEEVVYKSLCNKESENYPDATIVVVDASNLERNLLLFTQIYDLQMPTIMVLNMTDLAKKQNKSTDISALEKLFPEATILEVNARVRMGKERILEAVSNLKERKGHKFQPEIEIANVEDIAAQEIETKERFKRIAEASHVETIAKKKENKSDTP